MTNFDVTERNRVRRVPDRGAYDKETVYDIVDSALICHVGMAGEEYPFVIPTLHARSGDEILLHGATTSRLIRYASSGEGLCMTTTHIDGIVLARSVFHHSINYRSAVLFGHGRLVDDPEEKVEAMRVFTEKIMPGALGRCPATKSSGNESNFDCCGANRKCFSEGSHWSAER